MCQVQSNQQPSVVDFPALIRSLLSAMCWAVRLMPIRFLHMGHGPVVNMLDTTVGDEKVSRR